MAKRLAIASMPALTAKILKTWVALCVEADESDRRRHPQEVATAWREPLAILLDDPVDEREWSPHASNSDGDARENHPYDVDFLHAGVFGLGIERESMGQNRHRDVLDVFGDDEVTTTGERAGLRIPKEARASRAASIRFERRVFSGRVDELDEGMRRCSARASPRALLLESHDFAGFDDGAHVLERVVMKLADRISTSWSLGG